MSSIANKQVQFVAPINSLGYGIYTLGAIKQAIREGFQFFIEPIGHIDWPEIELHCEDMEIDINVLKSSIVDRTKILKDINGIRTIVMWHPEHLDLIENPELAIGLTQFEVSKLSDKAYRAMRRFGNIYVSNGWAKSILSGNYIKSANVSGPCIPRMLTKQIEGVESLRNYFDPKIIVVSQGKWESRKDQETLIEIYNEIDNPETVIFGFWHNAFSGGNKEPIQYLTTLGFKYSENLVIKLNTEITAQIWSNNKGGKVVIFPRIPRYIDLLRLYKTGAFVISLSKGEGFDLPVVEAIGMNMPVLITNNTAHIGYAPHKVIECKTTLAYDGRWFHGLGEWYPQDEPEEIRAVLATGLDMNEIENYISYATLAFTGLR